jgi:hypothetical protein
MTINPSELDSPELLNPYIYWSRVEYNGEPINERLVINYESKKFIPPNKIVFEVYRWGEWMNTTRSFDFVLSSYLDYVVCGSILNSRGNFEVTNAHKIIKDITIIFP